MTEQEGVAMIIFFLILGTGVALYYFYDYIWKLKETIRSKQEKIEILDDFQHKQKLRLETIIVGLVYSRPSVKLKETLYGCEKSLTVTTSDNTSAVIDLPPVPKVRRLK